MKRLGADVGALETVGHELARFASQVEEAQLRIDGQLT